jgi:hypothetical protein
MKFKIRICKKLKENQNDSKDVPNDCVSHLCSCLVYRALCTPYSSPVLGCTALPGVSHDEDLSYEIESPKHQTGPIVSRVHEYCVNIKRAVKLSTYLSR